MKCKHNIADVKSIKCPYCNKDGFKMLHWGHLQKIHNKTLEDVFVEFPNVPTMTLKESQRRRQKAKECSYKVKQTCIKKYGGIGYSSVVLKEKSEISTLKKYGFRNVMKNEQILNLFKGPNGIFSKQKAPERAEKISKSLKGKPSPLKGKTYKEIHGEKKTKKLIEDKRISGAIACSKCTNPSVPQVKLYELVKEIYPNTILNYAEGWYCIDIAILDKKIAIEYDGSYWHQEIQKDLERQKDLEKLGWKFIRYIDNIPSKEKLLEDINSII